METRRGIAKNVRFSVNITGDSGKHGSSVSTTHMALFNLEGTVVHASASRPPTIEEGDEVVIAGTLHDGVFDAPAMRNLTQGTIDHLPWAMGLVLGAIFLLVGGGAALYFLASNSDQGVAIVPLLFAVVGGYAVRTSNRYRAAEACVRTSTVTPT